MASSIDNLFARDGFWWWVGVVEDRMDPLKLGRVRARIVGYHLDNKAELPTDALPWAMPMQPIVSAAISGKGDTPLGPLEGTWVVGFFADGAECQQPIIMGTIGGIPGTSNACVARAQEQQNITNSTRDANNNVVRGADGNAVPADPVPVIKELTSSNSIYATLPPLVQGEVQNLMDSLGFKESSSIPGGAQNYATVNSLDYVGKYQFGAGALQTIGYLRTPIPKRTLTEAEMQNSTLWTGKNGINSLDDFKANKNNVQEIAMFENVKNNYTELKSLGVIDASQSSKEEVAGYLAAAHIGGAGGAKALKEGKIRTDNLGTGTDQYYALGVASVGGTSTTIPPITASTNKANTGLNKIPATYTDWAGILNNPRLGQPGAYSDPNSVYPTCDYTARADTNQLATNNDDKDSTPLPDKDKTRVEKIPTANNATGDWSEPPSAYNAKYPYNHVKETESGHVIELDDTPNAERIHIYHRTGTYVEIDREGSVSYKVKGENYEIYNRNNKTYVMGNQDITVDGARTLLVKNALDVEVLGKTTINIKNDADLNVSGDFNIKAKNLNIETQQDINFRIGNYMNVRTEGDLNYRVLGDEQHRVSGDFDLDASTVNINSGTANPTTAETTGLGDGLLSSIYGSSATPAEITGIQPLPTDIANTLNPVSKSMPSIFGKIGGGSISNIFNTGGLKGVISSIGFPGLNTVLEKSGVGNFFNILRETGFTQIDSVAGIINNTGLDGLNSILSFNKLPNFETILANKGIDLGSALGSSLTQTESNMLKALKDSGFVSPQLLEQGEHLISAFVKNGVTRVDTVIPQLIASRSVVNEFASWTDFPDATQLSRYFKLGDLSNRVYDVALQFPLMSQGNLAKSDIATNLKALAVNALDPIYSKYPNMFVSDAFKPTNGFIINQDPYNPIARLITSIRDNVSADVADSVDRQLYTITDYNTGNAANLHFKGVKSADYYDIAKWIKTNVAFDQLRLEYSTLGSAEPWITVVHKTQGTRPIDAPDRIVTAINGQVVANYLADITSIK